MEINKIYNENCIETMKKMPDNFVNLVVTSPPYDNLRTYTNDIEWNFDIFKDIAKELFRVIKECGVVVWIVGDATINGSETGTSFKQALYFKECGFNLHDTMIYHKGSFPPSFPNTKRYQNAFEYMFILSKGNPKIFNSIQRYKSINSIYQRKSKSSFRKSDGGFIYNRQIDTSKSTTIELNIWQIDCGYMKSTKYKEAYKHPAIFPEKLAYNHIITWSNENDLIYDPFMGSGTTAVVCRKLKRNFIGSEISKQYCDLIEKRLAMHEYMI